MNEEAMARVGPQHHRKKKKRDLVIDVVRYLDKVKHQ